MNIKIPMWFISTGIIALMATGGWYLWFLGPWATAALGAVGGAFFLLPSLYRRSAGYLWRGR